MTLFSRFATLVLFTGVLSAGFFLTPATAHLTVITSTPENGSEISVAPEELFLQFSMLADLDTAEASLRYLGGVETSITEAGRRDVRTEALVRTSAGGAGVDARFTLPELPAGLYAVDWNVREIDGHSNESSILFRVTAGTAEEPTESGAGEFSTPLYIASIIILILGGISLRRVWRKL